MKSSGFSAGKSLGKNPVTIDDYRATAFVSKYNRNSSKMSEALNVGVSLLFIVRAENREKKSAGQIRANSGPRGPPGPPWTGQNPAPGSPKTGKVTFLGKKSLFHVFLFTSNWPQRENQSKKGYFSGFLCVLKGWLYKPRVNAPKNLKNRGSGQASPFKCGKKGQKSDFFAEQKIYSYGIIYKYISPA